MAERLNFNLGAVLEFIWAPKIRLHVHLLEKP